METGKGPMTQGDVSRFFPTLSLPECLTVSSWLELSFQPSPTRRWTVDANSLNLLS